MNDRVQALIEPHLYPSYVGDYYRFGEQELAQFVEKIVRECATLAWDGPGGILEHFGVES